MDRPNILDEIEAVARRISGLIDANRKATEDHDFDFSTRLQAEIKCLQELREQLLGKPPKSPRGTTGSPV
jgi:hypothetical protein